jgi:hypothetical protein
MNIRKSIGLVGAGAVVVAALGLSTASANASSPPTGTHVSPMITCGWTPANNSGDPGGWQGNGEIIVNGPSTSCTASGEGFEGNSTYMHCQHADGSGVDWVYLTDYSQGVEGWVKANEVHWSGSLDQC